MLSFGGGGVQSTSVAEVPENITKMLGQYKKIAIIDTSGKFLRTGTEVSIKLNISFVPSRFFINITSNNNGNYQTVTIDSTKGYMLMAPMQGYMAKINKNKITYNNSNKTLKIVPEHIGGGPDEIKQIIAIE